MGYYSFSRKIKITIWFVALLALISACAKIGQPLGGPKDETPPVVLESEPDNFTVDFKGDRIEITFDEYVQVKNLNKELFVSPPFEEKPTSRLRKKTIVVELNNELKENTTYTLNFGSALVDLNEGNALPNYEFVFSTGDKLDTLSVSGKILRAFNLTPPKDPVYVMLYENIYDSVPLVEIPYYIGRTDKEGNYRINNIKNGVYKVFVLKDENSNFIYDLPGETIGFLDSTVNLSALNLSRDIMIDTTYLKNFTSTLFADSVIPDFVVDSVSGDTLIVPKKTAFTLHADMFIFEEETKKQYLSSRDREKEKIMLVFNRPLYDSLSLVPLNFEDREGLLLKEKSLNNDTVIYWITDTLLAQQDTLTMEAVYTVLDSLDHFITRTDTLTLRYRVTTPARTTGRRGQRDETQEQQTNFLKLFSNVKNNGTMHLKGDLIIQTEKPVFDVNNERIHLYSYTDSIENEEPVRFEPDTSLNNRKFVFTNDWKEATPYRLLVEPGAFTDIYGLQNDTLNLNFTGQKLDYYGTFILNLSGIEKNMIIQVLDAKENVVTFKRAEKPGIYTFDYMNPGVYKIKIILDSNQNGKWDTGNYLKKIQPEQVIYYDGTVEVRSNWDIDVTWNVTD